MRRSCTMLALTASSLVVLAACSDGAGDGEANDELTPITVGSLPIVDTAPLHLGVEEGIFAEHGLDVDLQLAQGGAAIVPAVISGDYQFGFSNVPSLFVASSQGLDLRVVASGNSTTGDPDADYGGILVQPDSDIDSPADLEGRSVSVNTLNNISDVTISELVAQDGGDPDSVEFVEMAFPDMPAALSSGQVDAVHVLEPFFTMAKEDGAQVIAHPFADVDPDMMVSAYFTSGDHAERDPELVESFTAAMEESLDYATENPEAARDILSAYTEIDPAITETMAMPRYPSEINADSVRTMADLALEYGLVPEAVDVEAILP